MRLLLGVTMTAQTPSPRRRRGRPRRCSPEILTRVVRLRADGALLREISSSLNAEGLPTPGGGRRWWPSHVQRLLQTLDAQQLMDEVCRSLSQQAVLDGQILGQDGARLAGREGEMRANV